MKALSFKATGVALAAIAALLSSSSVQAAGKKPASSQSCQSPALTVPRPVRSIFVRPVQSKPFPLPNGVVVDLSSDISNMAVTALTQTGNFAVMSAPEQSECGSHLELEATVSTLELNLYEIGVTVGYSPTGTHGAVSSVTGETKIKIGSLAMDFAIYECNARGCFSKVTARSVQQPTESDSKITVNWSNVTSAITLVTHPSFNKLLFKLLNGGFKAINESPYYNRLPWQALVTESDGGSGTFLFDAGSQLGIHANENFVVYAASSSGSSCVLHPVAYAHTLRADPVSSTAIIDQSFDSRPVQAGDVVMIRAQ